MAIPYFRMANCHTIIGAKRFHFRVRDGIWWFTLAMVTKQTGVKNRLASRRKVFSPSCFFLRAVFLASTLRLPLFNSFQVSRGLALSCCLACFACFPEICKLLSLAANASAVWAGFPVQACFAFLRLPCPCVSQTDWVLYGQASRAISTR